MSHSLFKWNGVHVTINSMKGRKMSHIQFNERAFQFWIPFSVHVYGAINAVRAFMSRSLFKWKCVHVTINSMKGRKMSHIWFNERAFPFSVQVYLVGGATKNVGRVELINKGTICDDGWTGVDTEVVCQSLGYTWGKQLFNFTSSIQPRGQIEFLNVSCTGIESNIYECGRQKGNWENVCNHEEDVAVECYNSKLSNFGILGLYVFQFLKFFDYFFHMRQHIKPQYICRRFYDLPSKILINRNLFVEGFMTSHESRGMCFLSKRGSSNAI